MLDWTFDNKMKELMKLQRQHEAIEEQMEVIKEEIKAEMTARGVDAIKTNKYVVTWKDVTSNRFDSAAFKKKYLALYESYTKPSISKRFTFKAIA